MIVAIINALLVLSLYLITGDAFKAETVYGMAFGMAGGILSAVLATGIIPIIEIIFNYTTDIKLLELADLNQPVLHDLRDRTRETIILGKRQGDAVLYLYRDKTG